MSKITFGYIVGGEDKHYNNLLRSLESLERIEQPYEVVILDADRRGVDQRCSGNPDQQRLRLLCDGIFTVCRVFEPADANETVSTQPW